MRVTYNKLVRDRIPEIIESDGHHAFTRILDGQDYRAALLAKLVEEAAKPRARRLTSFPASWQTYGRYFRLC